MFPDHDSKSARLFERAKKVLPGGNSRTSVFQRPYPLYAAHGDGCRITDVDGTERVDFVNNMSALIHGHGNRPILDAIARQSQQMLAVGMPTEVEIALAEEICSRVPSIERIRFANSGSEGIMFAIRAARAFTGRTKIAKAEGAYHGSAEAMEVSVAPRADDWGPANAPVSVPESEGLPQKVLDDVVVLPFNDIDASREVLLRCGRELAGVVVDPVVSRMALLRAVPGYVEMLREVTRELGAVLIFDEVFSFRLGYRGLQGEIGVQPDLTALGKIIGGGLPVGAVGGAEEIMAVFDPSARRPRVEHAGTYNANPMTMAAGKAALDQLPPEEFDRLAHLGDRLREGLRDALDQAGVPGQVTGYGSLTGMLFTSEPVLNWRDLRANAAAFARGQGFFQFLLNHGQFIVAPAMFILSTPMSEGEIDGLIDTASAALRETPS